ncbi:2Fe-2S iron-sulfur cluster binding domain-containing protein [Synechococcus sp. RSCCF101]|uniref:2Fe-2S iron-sulfur cluster-binding protein n=1 Tax=Synechococcus sp. RSCCF101 TaxID=2511069 RepID=UPI0012466296|nr:2Fe-2S iron-sulfur cluster-binding protein [Synechococcus sp. RSCCF101]QEY31964.1 2Fe-2S iron-sulfur cluster binding domain-containing protein [Synechococcus sp. RSCCF101]
MAAAAVSIRWPNGARSTVPAGTDWLSAASAAGFAIPTGCLGGSCGACEIDVNGQTVRACISTVPACRDGELTVELFSDPAWG